MKTPPLIPWPLIIATIIVIGIALFVSGCASMDYETSILGHEERHCNGWTHQTPSADDVTVFYEWQKARPASLKPWLYVRVSDTDTTCRSMGVQASGTRHIDACAIWQPVNCIIILQK